MHLLCHALSALRSWKVVKGPSPLGLWLDHRTQARFYVGQERGNCPLQLGLATPTQYSAYRCKKGSYVAFNTGIRQNTFLARDPPRSPLGELMSLPQIPSRLWTRFSRLRRSPLKLGNFGASVWRGSNAPKSFPLERRMMEHLSSPHFTNTLVLGAANMKPAQGGK